MLIDISVDARHGDGGRKATWESSPQLDIETDEKRRGWWDGALKWPGIARKKQHKLKRQKATAAGRMAD